MIVILTQDVKGKGKAGDVVKVNDGYARNMLIPKGLAKEANSVSLNDAKLQAGAKAEHERRALIEAQETSGKLGGQTFNVVAKGGRDGKLYGAVTTADIAECLAKAGYKIDKKKVVIDSPIKNVGVFKVRVKLHPKVSCDINIEVASEQ